MIVFVVIGALIILGLAIYAGAIFVKLRKQQAAQERAVKKLTIQKREAEIYARDSILILLRGLREEQVTMTEVAIRVTSLIQVLPFAERANYLVFTELANDTSHIPIKDEWKALSAKQKREYDAEREGLESQYKAKIDSAVGTILASGNVSAPVAPLFSPAKGTLH